MVRETTYPVVRVFGRQQTTREIGRRDGAVEVEAVLDEDDWEIVYGLMGLLLAAFGGRGGLLRLIVSLCGGFVELGSDVARRLVMSM